MTLKQAALHHRHRHRHSPISGKYLAITFWGWVGGGGFVSKGSKMTKYSQDISPIQHTHPWYLLKKSNILHKLPWPHLDRPYLQGRTRQEINMAATQWCSHNIYHQACEGHNNGSSKVIAHLNIARSLWLVELCMTSKSWTIGRFYVFLPVQHSEPGGAGTANTYICSTIM